MSSPLSNSAIADGRAERSHTNAHPSTAAAMRPSLPYRQLAFALAARSISSFAKGPVAAKACGRQVDDKGQVGGADPGAGLAKRRAIAAMTPLGACVGNWSEESSFGCYRMGRDGRAQRSLCERQGRQTIGASLCRLLIAALHETAQSLSIHVRLARRYDRLLGKPTERRECMSVRTSPALKAVRFTALLGRADIGNL